MAVSKPGTEVIARRYATLEDQTNFTVFIFQVGSRFKLKYKDTRANTNPPAIFTKWWDTQGAADQYIATYKQIKGVKTDDNRNRQGEPGKRRQGK